MKKKLYATTVICLSVLLNVYSTPNYKSTALKTHFVNRKTYAKEELVKNLDYDFSKSSIRSSYYDRLDQLAETIKDKKYAIALRGHADAIGTYKGNWVLSQKRADAVKEYLVKKGVPGDLIVSTAFGSTQPIASNKTAEGRQQNRRVEIKLQETNNQK